MGELGARGLSLPDAPVAVGAPGPTDSLAAGDYNAIVGEAIAGLDAITPEARAQVYARIRQIIAHHLVVSRQPASIVELETLSLDIAIRKIERKWRSLDGDALQRPLTPNPAREAAPVVTARAPLSAIAPAPVPPPALAAPKARRKAGAAGASKPDLSKRDFSKIGGALRSRLGAIRPRQIAVIVAAVAALGMAGGAWFVGFGDMGGAYKMATAAPKAVPPEESAGPVTSLNEIHLETLPDTVAATPKAAPAFSLPYRGLTPVRPVRADFTGGR
jgi:hypothetical protein